VPDLELVMVYQRRRVREPELSWLAGDAAGVRSRLARGLIRATQGAGH
jgi:hypothetical protein